MRIHEALVDGVLRTVVDTPVPLSPWQRLRVREWGLGHYRKLNKRGWKREGVERIVGELDQNTFLERPVPKFDCESEVTLFGG